MAAVNAPRGIDPYLLKWLLETFLTTTGVTITLPEPTFLSALDGGANGVWSQKIFRGTLAAPSISNGDFAGGFFLYTPDSAGTFQNTASFYGLVDGAPVPGFVPQYWGLHFDGLDAASVISFYFEDDGSGNPMLQMTNSTSGVKDTLLFSNKATGKLDVFTGYGMTEHADFQPNTMSLTPLAFSALPGSPTEGTLAWITNSTVNTWGSIIAGGGGNKVLGVYNGSNWTVAGV